MLFSAVLALGSSLLSYATALATKQTFSSRIQEDVTLRFVNNSGICETTPGVHQMSGYVDIGTGMSMVRFQELYSTRYFILSTSGFGFLRPGRRQKLRRLLFGVSSCSSFFG